MTMTEQANNIARDLLPGFLHFVSDKTWDDQFEDSIFPDLLRYVTTTTGTEEIPENELENVSHLVLDKLRNFTKVLCPQAFN